MLGVGSGTTSSSSRPAVAAPSGLQQRLEARYNKAVESYEGRIRELNAAVDEIQAHRVSEVKAFLEEGHQQVESAIADETRVNEEHEAVLAAQAGRCNAAGPGAVLDPFVDVFFEAGDLDLTASKKRMRSERMRLLKVGVAMRDDYQRRMDCISDTLRKMEEDELQRRKDIEAILSEFMLQLAKISYKSVTVSHVLVQRIIHKVNEQIAANHVAITTLSSKLSRREVLKQRHYSSQITSLYSSALQRMARSATLWLRTMLQSPVYRRPATRMATVESVMGVSGSTRREGRMFLETLGVIVKSLRDSRDVSGEPLESRQPCGGSQPAGWLRQYDPHVFHSVFTTSPMAVVDEWRMKANVVIRNSQASCVDLTQHARREETARVRAAEELKDSLLRRVEWLFTPLDEEPELLLSASIGKDEQEMDDVCTPFMVKNMNVISQCHADIENSTAPALRAVRRECEWFASTIDAGLTRSHEVFEGSLLVAIDSVLRVFERATACLVETATDVFGFIRQFHKTQYEALRDHEDRLALLEDEYTQLGDKLTHASTAAAGEELFAQGLLCLEQISQEHAQFHKQTIESLLGVGDRVEAYVGERCGALVKKTGLEAENDTEERLILERQERIDAALAQQAKKKGKKSTINAAAAAAAAAASDDTGSEMSRSSFMLALMDEIPLEDVRYNQIEGADGITYNIVAPLAFAPEPAGGSVVSPSLSPSSAGASILSMGNAEKAAVPSKGGNKGSMVRKKGEQPVQAQAEAVDIAFTAHYSPMLADNISDPENFITVADVQAWRDLLRVELVMWATAIRHSTKASLETFCRYSREENDKETNRILREHRRRPAAFQADLYEARVREIENETNSSQKYCARLRERVEKVQSLWDRLHSNATWQEEDRNVLEEMQQLQKKAEDASTTASLQVQERRFASLTTQYIESFEQRCRTVVDSVEKQKESIEQECRHFLASRAEELGGLELAEGTTLQAAIDKDPITQQVKEILELLSTTVASVRRFAEEEMRSREATMLTAREGYDVLYKQSMAELQLLSRIQEAFARLRAQVQSMLLLSATEQDKLMDVIDALEGKLNDPIPRPNLVPIMKLVTQKDYALETSKEAPVEEVGPEADVQLDEDLEQQLQSVRVFLQRYVRSCDAAETLGILDALRGMLYQRGVALGALICAVEMVRVSPDYYVEPKPMSAALKEEASAAARGGRRSRAKVSAAAAAIVDPLPTVTPFDAQLKQWITGVKTEVLAVVQAHFTTYAPPLTRRMPGMRGGSLEDIQTAVDAVCTTQEDKARDHLSEASRTYHHQVQRVFIALQAMPQYLAAAVFAVAAAAVERRVGSVMDVFGGFYSYSSAMKALHRGVVKVSLGAKGNQDRLAQLKEAESIRQEVTRVVLERFWGYVIREMQDEAGLHAARCVNTCNTFFNLLRGIPTPEHLAATDADIVAGEHRGIRHLMKLRDKEGRLQDSEQGAAVKERRLQETMPLLKQEVVAKSKERTAEGLPLPVYSQMDYKGLPLCAFRPLDQFNNEHPRFSVQPPVSAGNYYPVGSPENLSAQPQQAAKKTKKKASEVLDDDIGVSPSFAVPPTRMHQETIALARESVHYFNHTSQEVTSNVASAFQSWIEREDQWEQSWALTLARLNITPQPTK